MHPQVNQGAAGAGTRDAALQPALLRDYHTGHGTVVSLPVPGTVSGVQAAPATVYLPPQYGAPGYTDRTFPVVELLFRLPRRPAHLDARAARVERAGHPDRLRPVGTVHRGDPGAERRLAARHRMRRRGARPAGRGLPDLRRPVRGAARLKGASGESRFAELDADRQLDRWLLLAEPVAAAPGPCSARRCRLPGYDAAAARPHHR